VKEALADRIARLVVIPVRLPGDYGKLEELRRRVGEDGVGGLLLFGVTGFILGPILAALFVTAWEMFGTAFRSALAEPGSAAADPAGLPPA